MKKVVLFLLLFVMFKGKTTCQNLNKRFFLTIDISCDNNPVQESLRAIKYQLCRSRSLRMSSIKCFLKFKIVGETRVIVVVGAEDSAELDRRVMSLPSPCRLQFESEPLVGYDNFARLLGVDESLIQLQNNTLDNVREAQWCEFNVNFGDKNATEVIAIWKEEAELVFQSRNSGIALEIFKTLGERTVHLIIQMDADSFDQILFNTPFNREIHSTLKTTCKTVVMF